MGARLPAAGANDQEPSVDRRLVPNHHGELALIHLAG